MDFFRYESWAKSMRGIAFFLCPKIRSFIDEAQNFILDENIIILSATITGIDLEKISSFLINTQYVEENDDRIIYVNGIKKAEEVLAIQIDNLQIEHYGELNPYGDRMNCELEINPPDLFRQRMLGY